ncbi:MAG: hypothetical protein QNJ16_02950 [Rhodobacter sp.]|nr:hypothetical protein [Rhodobacter sp.]
MEFYDQNGEAKCYSPDGEHLYTWDGNPVAYFSDSKVYSFSGKLLGWFENGWLYDRGNNPALFMPEASGGPMRPMRQMPRMKSMRRMRPMKSLRSMAHMRPMRSNHWSPFIGTRYFDQ